MIAIDNKGYFITGSDTDVGKTHIGCELIRQLRQHGKQLEIRKPAESGCQIDDNGGLIAADATKLNVANDNAESIDRVCAFRFQAALAPHRAARLQGDKLHLTELVDTCSRDDDSHLLFVEGAGGFYSPLAEDGLNADLAGVLQLPLIIVISDKIGAVNQSLMALQAVESRHLPIAAVIMNQTKADQPANMNNTADLRQYCNYPIFHCGFQQTLPTVFQNEN
ncbi:MAG: dethiobiotin synthase [Gammaproteobacteria bacterium]|nr:dethiobiotin synthase [Gammaproteobacteria bacterium]